MKRNTLAKKLMAALLTGTMIMSMGMTSFATTGVHDGGTSGVTGVTLTKKITGADNEYTPNVDFTFNVSNDLSEVELGYQPAAETENKDIPRLKGVMSAITSSLNVKFEAETGSPSNAAKTRTGTISFNASEYKAPGIYRYKITEDARIDYAGITSDPTTYYMDVYVTDKSGEGAFSPLISYVVVFKANGDTFSKSDLVFENKYETNKLTLTKEVAGNQGNRTDKFNFTIVIKGEPGDKFVTSKGTFEYKETGTATLMIELGHDETVTISGLSADDTYEITEAGSMV